MCEQQKPHQYFHEQSLRRKLFALRKDSILEGLCDFVTQASKQEVTKLDLKVKVAKKHSGVSLNLTAPFLSLSELQIREDTEDNSKVIFLVSQ